MAGKYTKDISKNTKNPALQAKLQEKEDNAPIINPRKFGNPRWLVPTFCTLLILGLLWVVVFYITQRFPIPLFGNWNILVGFVFMMVGFGLTLMWK
jgi:hypothetical protein